jgi:tRNA threonylcarbamoyladenosine biosynthesis protein TsaB
MTLPGERPILALDSSTQAGAVAIGTASGLLAEVLVNVRARHSSGLLPAVDQAMKAANVQPRDLGAVVVGSGPGSFTGLRIAGATAKGVVHALGIPLFAYSSLLATAAQAWSATSAVCAVIDARGRDVFAATYRFGTGIETLDPPRAQTIDELIARFTGVEPPLFVGEGVRRHHEELSGRLGAAIAPDYFGLPRGAALVWLASRFGSGGIVNEPAQWEPEYLRPSGAERIAADRGGGKSS